MNTYTVDKAKELIVLSNPLWNKYISICGTYHYDDEKDYMYLANEKGTANIRIDESFLETVLTDGISDGDSIRVEGFLNYRGRNQKSKDDKNTKAANVSFENSSFYLFLTPKRIERTNNVTPDGLNKPKQIPQGCASSGCAGVFLFIVLCIITVYFTL